MLNRHAAIQYNTQWNYNTKIYKIVTYLPLHLLVPNSILSYSSFQCFLFFCHLPHSNEFFILFYSIQHKHFVSYKRWRKKTKKEKSWEITQIVLFLSRFRLIEKSGKKLKQKERKRENISATKRQNVLVANAIILH